ncbi:MAG: gamma-glutamyltransferase [Neisseriaceae bacterium]
MVKQKRRLALCWVGAWMFLAGAHLSEIAEAKTYQPNATQQASAAYEGPISIQFPIYAKHGMVVSEQALASQIGLDILKKGGNAVDAAVAVAFSLAVVLPSAGNLGGGGFMMLYHNSPRKITAIDFREVAPHSVGKDTFVNASTGKVIDGRSIYTPYASGVPGTVGGLEYAWKKYGKLPWATLIAPAIKLADKGFRVTRVFSNTLNASQMHLARWPATKKIFFPGGRLLQEGDLFVQKDLAQSLRLIAKDGARAFYHGKIADKLAAAMRPFHWIDRKDLANYRVIERQPLKGTYKGYEVVTMPPPSSGGVHLLEILNLLERWPLAQWGVNSANTIHYMAEASKLAYADRAVYLGDPGFVHVPVKGLLSKSYADAQAGKIRPTASAPSTISAGNPMDYERDETTHFSVVDKDKNAVSMTYTLNGNFGSGLVADGTGILLNNEMDDFALQPGTLNLYGLSGGKANAVQPGKRPLSSMTPTFVLKNNQLYLVTGSPGGARIITTVLQVILNDIEFHLNPAEAVALPRVHHQGIPEELRVEKALNPDTVRLLEQKGHRVVVKPTMGRSQSIRINEKGELEGASDSRDPDGLAVGY